MFKPPHIQLTLLARWTARACRAGMLAALLAAPPIAWGLDWQNRQHGDVALRFAAEDAPLADALASQVVQGRKTVADFFGAGFPATFDVRLFPDRAPLTDYWRVQAKDPGLKPECWMVANGTAQGLTLLSPRVWGSQACDHDARDAVALQRLITHELVHVYHGQSNPSPDFDGLEGIDWFVEGLANYASGQLDAKRLAGVRAALAAQAGKPLALKQIWTGRDRYGQAGSLVAYIDRRYGRPMLARLLRATSQQQVLDTLGLSEAQLVADWRASVLN